MENLLTKLDLQFFAEDSAEVVETVDTEEVVTSEEVVETSDKEIKTFTQEQLDAIVADRLKRERKKFEGFDELKNKATEYEQKLEEQRLADLSEVERAQEVAKQLEEKLKEAQDTLTKEREGIRKQRIVDEFKKVAASANIIDLDVALALTDLSSVEVSETGEVLGVKDLVDAIVTNKPYLVEKKVPQQIGQATNSGASSIVTDKSADQLLAEAAEKARNTGRPEDKLAYVKLKKQFNK